MQRSRARFLVPAVAVAIVAALPANASNPRGSRAKANTTAPAGEIGTAVAYIRTRARVVTGTAADDTIDVRNGIAQTVSCGPGHDVVIRDRLDRVARSCEVVR